MANVNQPLWRLPYLAEQIQNLVEHAVPIVRNGNWWMWDISAGAYVDSGLSAEGAESWHGLADDFSSGASYAVGDLVMFNGELYACITAHSGAWTAADFAKTTVDAQKASWAVALGAYPTETSTGASASTECGADGIPLKSLTVPLVAVWDGSGTPSTSNIREVSGWTGVNIARNAGQSTIPVSWQTEAGEVYGGELNVLTGVLTVSHWGHVFTGDETITAYSVTTARWEIAATYKGVGTGDQSDRIPYSSHYKAGGSSSEQRVTIGSSGLVFFFSNVLSDSDVDTWKEYLADQYEANTPVTIVWLLETPKTFQLTPNAVKSILGENTLTADTGNISAVFRCDPNLYIAAQVDSAIGDAIGGSY